MTQDQGWVPCRTVSTAQVVRGADRHSFNGYSHSQPFSIVLPPLFYFSPLPTIPSQRGLLCIYTSIAKTVDHHSGVCYTIAYQRCLAGTL
jgi:hypothetical protein